MGNGCGCRVNTGDDCRGVDAPCSAEKDPLGHAALGLLRSLSFPSSPPAPSPPLPFPSSPIQLLFSSSVESLIYLQLRFSRMKEQLPSEIYLGASWNPFDVAVWRQILVDHW